MLCVEGKGLGSQCVKACGLGVCGGTQLWVWVFASLCACGVETGSAADLEGELPVHLAAGGRGVRDHVDLDAALQQVNHRLLHAHMRLKHERDSVCERVCVVVCVRGCGVSVWLCVCLWCV